MVHHFPDGVHRSRTLAQQLDRFARNSTRQRRRREFAWLQSLCLTLIVGCGINTLDTANAAHSTGA